MSEIRKNLGGVTAYAYARSKGYTGTEEEFAQLMANYATVGETATEAAEQATTKAGEASTSATNAATSASAASASATSAAGSASAAATSESNAASSATSASGSATQAATSATAAQAAQAAAEEVAESIPEDYSELSADVDDLKNALNDTDNGILYSDLIDQFKREPDGFIPQPSATVVSYFDRVDSTPVDPFYPYPMGEWYPVADLVAVYRYVILTLPTDLANTAMTIGFWVKNTNIAPARSIRFSLRDASQSYVADFTRYISSTLYVGATQTKNDCTALIDQKIDDWYHVKITIPANKNVAQLIAGSDFALATDKIYYSLPVVIVGDQYWFIKYPNKYYHPQLPDGNLVDILFGKKIGWIGDSIMLGRHTNEDYGWYNKLESLGCIVSVEAVNGAMVSVKGSGYHSIINETSSGTFDADTDYIIFDGGANDYFQRQAIGTITDSYSGTGLDTSTYIGAFEQVCYNLMTNYPNAKIGYIIPYKMQTYADIQGQKDYFDNAIEVCKKWGVPVLDLRYMCDLNYNITSLQQYFKDNVHINKDGYIYTENIIAEWLRSI